MVLEEGSLVRGENHMSSIIGVLFYDYGKAWAF